MHEEVSFTHYSIPNGHHHRTWSNIHQVGGWVGGWMDMCQQAGTEEHTHKGELQMLYNELLSSLCMPINLATRET